MRWKRGASVFAVAFFASAVLSLRPVSAVESSHAEGSPGVVTWESTALLEHEDRKARLVKVIEASSVGDATVYQALVSHADLPGITRDVPILRLVFSERVFFDTDKISVRPEARNVIQLVADALRADLPDVAVFIAGHADARGSDAYNYDLSLRRAHAVAVDLFHATGGDRKIWEIGFGEAVPFAPNTTPENMGLNRRVEFLFAARAEVVAVWLSKQGDTVCEGYSETVRATCREKITTLPATVALPVFEQTASVDPMVSQQQVIDQVNAAAKVELAGEPVATSVGTEKVIVAITRQTPVVINLVEQRVTLGQPQF